MTDSILVNGLTISYERVARSDQTILFLHHNSGSSGVWDDQWNDPRLDGYTLVRVDLPGQGRSSRSHNPDADYTLPALGRVLTGIVEQLDIRNYVIAALSISTNITGEAARGLTGCKGFFLTGSSVIGEGITPADILLPFEYGGALFEEAPGAAELKDYVRGLVYDAPDTYVADLMSWYRQADPALRPALGRSIGAGEWTDEIGNLEANGMPVMLVYGEQERIVNRDYILKARPGAWRNTIRVLEKAGHLAHLDQPAAFNALLLQFAGETLH